MKLNLFVFLGFVALVTADSCPDGSDEKCPDHMTCCPLRDGQIGCCPFQNAMCCLDQVHCCPEGLECDVPHQSCRNSVSSVLFPWRVPVLPVEVANNAKPIEIEEKESSVLVKLNVAKPVAASLSYSSNSINEMEANLGKCPDGLDCRDSFTCCVMIRGGYGCCPYQNAQCCSDKIHCCPSGTHCNIKSSSCENDLISLASYNIFTQTISKFSKIYSGSKVLAAKAKFVVNDVVCPDKKSECPNGNTCCPIGGKEYGCCPMNKATCCSDMEHCCPNGYICADDGCEKGSGISGLPFLSFSSSGIKELKDPIVILMG